MNKCIDAYRSEEITELQMKSMYESSNKFANKIKTQRKRQDKESESEGSDDDEKRKTTARKKISCKFCGLEHVR